MDHYIFAPRPLSLLHTARPLAVWLGLAQLGHIGQGHRLIRHRTEQIGSLHVLAFRWQMGVLMGQT